jgi:flagellar motility protein MotE (MotC chaperone)
MKALHALVAAKVVALGGIALFMYTNRSVQAQSATSSELPSEKKSELPAQTKSDNPKLPEVPDSGLSLSRAADIRNQLLLIRKDVEQKMEKMNVAREAYDRSKADVESKLKRIEEERRLLEETLQKEKKAKEERLSETLEILSKMEPKKAAPLFEAMDRDLVMQLIKKLPVRQVTKLLEAVNPKKATEILEYYTRIRSGREYELLREMGLCASGSEEGSNDKSTTPKNEPPRQGERSGASGDASAAGSPSTAAQGTGGQTSAAQAGGTQNPSSEQSGTPAKSLPDQAGGSPQATPPVVR